ncbi:hypothetical protein R6Q59_002830 [Mikania micrantha]
MQINLQTTTEAHKYKETIDELTNSCRERRLCFGDWGHNSIQVERFQSLKKFLDWWIKREDYKKS